MKPLDHIFYLMGIGLLQFISTLSYGQQNPFDLKYRLQQEDRAEITINVRPGDTISESVLPVDSSRITSILDTVAAEKYEDQVTSYGRRGHHAIESVPDESDTAGIFAEPVEKQGSDMVYVEEIQEGESTSLPLPPILQQKKNLIFATFLILLIMLTLVISINRSVVDHVFRAFMNDNYLNLLYREQRGKRNIQLIFLYFFFIANLGFFIFLSLDYWFETRPQVSLLFCILIVGLIYFMRYLTMELLASTFPVEKEAKQFNFTIVIFNILLGFILLPVNLFFAFGPGKVSLIAFYFGVTLFLLFYIIRQLRGLFIGVRFIKSAKFQLFAYLCTVEIVPLLVGIKTYFVLTS